jgi:hypothetical protein
VLSATGAELSEYHIDAAIASIHACALRLEDTDWGTIVSLYDTLLTIHPSPVVALNRAIAVAQHEGPDRGLMEILSITDSTRLASYPFYFAACGEPSSAGRREAREHPERWPWRAPNGTPVPDRRLNVHVTHCASPNHRHPLAAWVNQPQGHLSKTHRKRHFLRWHVSCVQTLLQKR